MNIEKLKAVIIKENIEWRKHVFQRMLERDIKREDVKEVVINGELIEDYENDKPFPSALFFKLLNNRPLHVVAALDDDQNKVYIITAYEATLDVFENDFKTRKKK